jgi:hypothetical protein
MPTKTRPGWRKVLSVGSVVALTLGLVGAAVVQEGFATTELDLNDSGVWVTNQSRLTLGRFNYNAGQLDGSLVASTAAFDVLQDGATVFLQDLTGGLLYPVNTSRLQFAGPVDLGVAAKTALGGGRAAVFVPDGEAGHLWSLPGTSLASFRPDVDLFPPALTDLSAATVVTVGTDGRAHVFDPLTGRLVTLGAGDADAGQVVAEWTIHGASPSGAFQITAVGGTPVVWDQAAATLYLADDPVAVTPAEGEDLLLALQQPSGTADAVVYQTASALVYQPLDGGEPSQVALGSTGQPAAAVQLGGCTYAVWSVTAQFVRDCPGEDLDLAAVVPGASAHDELRFRVNRGHVVLNQVSSGGVWLVTDDIIQVDNWDDVIPSDDGGDEDDETRDDIEEEATIERDEVNHPPVAKADTFGVRAGTSTLLPVVENDTDDDGDLLTVELEGRAPAAGDLTVVYNNSVFQIDVPPGERGTFTFQYRVSDGRGGEDTATVTVEIHEASANAEPEQVRSTRLVVGSNQTIRQNILTDWRDPDGDALILVGVTGPDGDTVDFRPDGTLIFQDNGRSSGVKTVTVEVSDGRLTATGEVYVEVRPGNQAPRVLYDLASGPVGTSLTVHPLDNDYDPEGQALRLVSVESLSGDVVPAMDSDAGTFTVSSSEPKTAYFLYTVTDGPSIQQGLVRVDFLPAAEPDAAPIAVPDSVSLLLETTAAVLANDVNPLGYPLVITDVTLPAGSPVDVVIVDHEALRITQRTSFTQPVTFTYEVSNGHASARTTVTVLSAEQPDRIMSPVAVDDTVRVRAGDIATVEVLANDSHPNDIPLRLVTELANLPDPDTEALVFTSENTVRIHARQAGTYDVFYQVEGTQGTAEPATARLRIVVTAPASETGANQAPRPVDIEARTLTGLKATIRIPLDGIDPDGDFVSLVGVSSAPAQGRIDAVGADTIVYDPGTRSAGMAQFTYTVRDRHGATATATITVGIAPRPAENSAPVAVADSVQAQPNRQQNPRVTLNDYDPDGDEFGLVRAASADFAVETTSDGRLIFTTPAEAGDYSIAYTVADSFGQEGTGYVSVHVAADVPPSKPVARDDVVAPLAALEAALAGTGVTIEYLVNDDDPDGSVLEDTFWIEDVPGLVRDDAAHTVTIPVTAELQILDYSLTDPDGLVGEAFITIPGVDSVPPQFNPSAVGLEVRAGSTTTVAVADYVIVRAGRTPLVTEAARVSAWNGTATATQTELTFTAPADYVGQASISVEVTDGTGVDDPAGLVATVTIPVRITAADGSDNQPPTMQGAALQVAEGDPASLALVPLVQDFDDTEFTFEVVTQPHTSGLAASVDGGTLTVDAAAGVAKGTTDSVVVAVSDGHNTPVQARINLTVVASTRPLAQAVDDDLGEVHQGEPQCVQATANDINPFSDQGELRLVEAVVEAGTGTAATGCSGDGSVGVTPDADFHGQLVVRYTIEDATEDPDRRVQGRIRMTVLGRPEAPTGLRIEEVGDQRVRLSWQPPDNNGSPIVNYTVTGVPAFSQTCGNTTICDLTGLTNNVTYTFTVTATNAVGTSGPSAPSAEARPDTFPNHPQPPTLQFGDRSLTITYADPGSRGSPVHSFILEISPPPGTGAPQQTAGLGTTFVWTGLTNGTEYRVRICAVNDAPGVCDDYAQWSDYSVGEIPAGPPRAPGTPNVTRLEPIGGQAQVQVCWTAPTDVNGAAVTSYTVRASTGAEMTTGNTCQVFNLAASTANVTFTVAATNKAGLGDWSAASDPIRPFVHPGPVTGLYAGDLDGACSVTFNSAALNGATSSEVVYYWQASNGASGNFGAATSGTATGLPNNGSYTVEVWARTTVQGQSYDGPHSTSNSCNPYGTPNKPSVNATYSGSTVTLSWGVPAANGRPIDRVEISIDGGAWVSQGTASGSENRDTGYGQQHCIKARVYDSLGQASAEASACATPPINPSVTLSRANRTDGGDGSWFWADLSGFTPNSTVTGTWFDPNPQRPIEGLQVDGNGNWSGILRQRPGYGAFWSTSTGCDPEYVCDFVFYDVSGVSTYASIDVHAAGF